jgi:hypothetical protein
VARRIIAVVTLVFAGALLVLTVGAALAGDIGIVALMVSALVLALLVVGIVGALLHNPEE